MTSRAAVLAAALLLVASASAAQSPDPIPRFVFDVRGTSTGLPTTQGWTPVVPTGAEVPSRALGFEFGGHVRVVHFGGASLSLGATFMTAKGTVAPEATDPATPALVPDVSTRFTSLAPQVSLGFGHRLGFSYISAGLGRARVRSEATLAGAPAGLVEGDWTRAINFGGGARWFITDHFGVNFDLRWHQLAAVTADVTHPAAPRTTMLVLGVGISLQ